MAQYTCPYSGFQLQASYVPLTLQGRALAHPIFYASSKQLFKLYARFSKGELDTKSSYLLFLALLNQTDMVKWSEPCQYLGAKTDKLVISYMHSLVTVLWETDVIEHPSFKQTGYIFSEDNNNLDLSGGPDWIATWQANIEDFKDGYVTTIQREKLLKVEKQVERVILSNTDPRVVASSVARWAAIAGSFPKDKVDSWKRIIRKCYNHEAMFSTPRSELLALKEYCELNIEAGTIHFHKLMEVLTEGIARHDGFLGIDISSAVEATYEILPDDASKEETAMAALIHTAPKEKPRESEYPSKIAYLRAKMKWEAAQRHASEEPKQ